MSDSDPRRTAIPPAQTLADQFAAGAFAGVVPQIDQQQPQCSEPLPEQAVDPRVDVVGEVLGEVDQFVRSWVGRFRHVVIRASQLTEQEVNLKKTLAAIDAQQAEWTRRTEDRERTLEEQTKLISEAWLNLENERRAKLQHRGAAGSGSTQVLPQGNIQPPLTQNAAVQTGVAQVSPTRCDVVTDDAGTSDPNPANQLLAASPSHPPGSGGGSDAREKIENPPSDSETSPTSPGGAMVVNRSPLANPAPQGGSAHLPPAANPSVEPINPWQNQTQAAVDATSDAVKQFKKLRREIRGN